MEWIKTENEKPEINHAVLVTVKSGFDNKPSYTFALARYCKDGCWIDCDEGYSVGNVIAWQELPKVYVDEEFKANELQSYDGCDFTVLVDFDNVPEWPHYTLQTIKLLNVSGKHVLDRQYFKTEQEAVEAFDKASHNYEVKGAYVYDTNMSTIKHFARPL
jgi:hypothetical protein